MKRLLFISICLSILGSSVYAQFRIDRQFATDGFHTANPHTTGNEAALTYAIEKLPDGSYLVAGGASGLAPNVITMTVQKFKADGTADMTFGGGDGVFGFALNPFNSEARGIVTLPDGKIIVAGYSSIEVPGFTPIARETLVRLNGDGTVDNTFATNGYFIQPHDPTSLNDVGTEAWDVELLSDGRIVTAGMFDPRFSSSHPCATNDTAHRCSSVAIYDEHGMESAREYYDLGAGPDTEAIRDIEVQSDDLIVGAITNLNVAINDFSLVRFNANGVLDPTFGVNGIARTSDHFGQTALVARNVEILPDGKLLLSGNSNGLITARFLTDGTLDSSYGTGGKTPAIATTTSRAIPGEAMIVKSDGKILATGSRNKIVQLNPDGSPDLSFGNGGVLEIAVGASTTLGYPSDMVLEPNGNLTFTSRTSLLGAGQGGTDQWHTGRLNANRARFDFDGDAKSDVSVFRRPLGEWWYLRSSDGLDGAFAFGSPSDIPVPADFTGDGIADFSFWRPSTGEWFVLQSDNTGFYSFPFGASGDIPAPGDFDGDGTDDAAVFRPATGTWFIQRSSDGNTDFVSFGASTDVPLVGDYDGDGSDDVAIYKPDVSQFWQLRSTEGLRAFAFGQSTDIAMTADFSGDGTDDMVVWRPSTGFWFVLNSEDSNFFGFPFGANGDIPAPGDYDGDGTADPTVFRPADTTWYSLQSTAGATFTPFGSSTDEPLPAAYNAD